MWWQILGTHGEFQFLDLDDSHWQEEEMAKADLITHSSSERRQFGLLSFADLIRLNSSERRQSGWLSSAVARDGRHWARKITWAKLWLDPETHGPLSSLSWGGSEECPDQPVSILETKWIRSLRVQARSASRARSASSRGKTNFEGEISFVLSAKRVLSAERMFSTKHILSAKHVLRYCRVC